MKYILLVLTSLFFINTFSQSINYAPDEFIDTARTAKMKAAFPVIEKMYESYAKNNHVPGLAFGIVSGGKLIFSGNTGVQNTSHALPVTSSSIFRIASMTKSFTAMAILQLRDAGKLKLDDPVTQYIPQLNKTHPLTTDSRPLTIRNLLTHTAGFPEDNPWADRELDMTDAELMLLLNKGISIANNPGQQYEYSNLGFALLGHIITKVSGQPFDEYITGHILRPLGMSQTEWEYSRVPANHLVLGYSWVNGQWKEEKMLRHGAMGASGGLLTSIDDFSKYMILHLSAWPARNEKSNGTVKRATIREMHAQGVITKLRNQPNNPCAMLFSYNDGLVWTKDCTGRTALQHSGGLPGFGSDWIFLPEYDIAVVSMTNLTYAAPAELNAQIIDTLIKMAGVQPRVIHTSAILEERKHQLIQLLPGWNDVAKTNIFSESFFKDYIIDSLKKEAKLLFDKAGAIIEVSEVIPVNQLRGYFVVSGEKAKLDIWFTLSPESPARIQEYKLSEHK